ncbi:MAG: OsmC family protein [Pseudomonadota bacterium]
MPALKATVTWQQAVKFLGKTGDGHEVLMDGPPQFGGENAGPRPMEMVLLGLGGCASFDVIHILGKSRESPVSCEVELTAERADTVPAVFTHIHMHFKVSGVKLKESAVEKAVTLSAEKYCSVSKMLRDGNVKVDFSYEVVGALES